MMLAASRSSTDWTYTYDHLDQLLTADNAGDNTIDESFVYSDTGNLLSRTRLGQSFTYPAATDPRPHALVLLIAFTSGEASVLDRSKACPLKAVNISHKLPQAMGRCQPWR